MRTLPRGSMRLLVIFALSAVAGEAATTTEPAARRFEYYLADALNAETTLATERAIVAAELEAGLARGAWTADEKAAADALLVKTFEPRSLGRGRLRPYAFLARSMFEASPSTIPSTAPLLATFRRRLEALDFHDEGLRTGLRLAALAYADAVWLQARKPSDLLPAQEALKEAKVLVAQWDDVAARRMSSGGQTFLPALFNTRPSRGRTPYLAMEESVELVDYWTIVAAADPLLLPTNPAADPVAYTRFRATWRMLQGFGHRFVARPAIRCGVGEMDDEFRHACAAAVAEVKGAILRGVPIADLREPVRRMRQFSDEIDLPPLLQTRRPFTLGFPDRNTPLDYRYMIERTSPTTTSDLLSARLREECRCYGMWLALLEAEAAGDGETIALTQNALRLSLRRGSGPELDLMRRHLPAETPPLADPASAVGKGQPARPVLITAGEPAAALLANLRAIRSLESDDHRGLLPLITSWQAVQERTAPPAHDRSGRTTATWLSLASWPEGATLLALRDRAAWAALGRPVHPTGGNIASELMAQFEAALERNEWAEAERLLTLDRACAALAPDTGTGCEETLRLMREAAGLSARGQLEQAREIFRAIIRSDATPTSGAMAARALKALPPAPSPRKRTF